MWMLREITMSMTNQSAIATKAASASTAERRIEVRATSQQEAATRQRHVAPVAAQTEHAKTAQANPELRASSTTAIRLLHTLPSRKQ